MEIYEYNRLQYLGVECDINDEYSDYDKKLIEELPSDLVISCVLAGDIEKYMEDRGLPTERENEQLFERIISDFLKDSSLFGDRCYNIRARLMYKSIENLMKNFGKYKKEIESISKRIVLVNTPKLLSEIRKDIRSKINPTAHEAACARLAKIYPFLSEKDLRVFKYFVLQSLNPELVPASCRICLYLWSSTTEKGTGKTTVADTIAAILNGKQSIRNTKMWRTDVMEEIQMKSNFDEPQSCKNNVVVADDNNPYDMKKIYGKVKTAITSNGRRVNVRFKGPVEVENYLNLIITTNYSVDKFITEDSERRIFSKKWDKAACFLTFEEIYKAWSDFIYSCEPMADFQKEYFDLEINEIGRASIRKDAVIATLLSDEVYQAINDMKNTRQISLQRIFNIYEMQFWRSSSEVTSMATDVVNEFFGQKTLGGYYWLKTAMIKKLDEERLKLEPPKEEDGRPIQNDLPF